MIYRTGNDEVPMESLWLIFQDQHVYQHESVTFMAVYTTYIFTDKYDIGGQSLFCF